MIKGRKLSDNRGDEVSLLQAIPRFPLLGVGLPLYANRDTYSSRSAIFWDRGNFSPCPALVSLALGSAVCLSLESNQTWAPPRHAGDTEIDLRLFQTPRLTGA